MKHILFTFLITLLFVSPNFAQEGSKKDKAEQFKSMKIAYLTQKLSLTSDEAEGFWPIYNKHQNKIYHLRFKDGKELSKKLKADPDLESITDSEAEDILKQFIKIDTDIQTEQSTMYEELKVVLSSKKLLKLHRAEIDFNRKMLEQFRRKRESKNSK